MARIISLVSILLLAGCASLGDGTSPPAQLTGLGPMSLSYVDTPDAPERVQSGLQGAFMSEAVQRGIAFDPSLGGTVRITGYVSFVASTAGTLTIFVFDFADQTGNRLLRMSGQFNSLQSPADPWAVVDDDAILAMASQALEEFVTWSAENSVGA